MGVNLIVHLASDGSETNDLLSAADRAAPLLDLLAPRRG